jgi:hypothetical protein
MSSINIPIGLSSQFLILQEQAKNLEKNAIH